MKNTISMILVAMSLLWGGNAAAQQAYVHKISPNVFSIFLHHYHSLVVIGDKGVLITDPANATRADLLKSEVSKLTALPITKVVLTHEHYDHIGGTEVFTEAEIYAHKAVKPVLRLDVTGQAPKKIHHYVGDQATLHLGMTEVDLLHYGAADGVGMLAIHLPKERVVLSADLYEVNELTNGMFLADSNFLGSRRVLNALVDFEPLYAITTHSQALDPKHLKLASEFYNDLFNIVEPKVKAAMSKGFSEVIGLIKTLPKEVVLDKYKMMSNYHYLPAHVERMIFSVWHGG